VFACRGDSAGHFCHYCRLLPPGEEW
jgi:hypothetical protein